MSKFLTKSVKKVTLLSVILAIILAAAIVVGTLFGFNKDATVKSSQTVTISTYKHNEAYLDDIKSDCEDIFSDKVLYEMESTVLFEDIIEHVYVFSSDADLEETVAAVKAHFEARKNDANDELAINDVVVNIAWHKESNVSYLANGYVSRAIIAGVVFAILAFVYVTLRFRRWDMGLLVTLAIVLGIGFTTALIALVRIPVTASTVYAIAGAGLLSAITAIMTLHRVRLASKEEGAKNKSAEEIVVSSIAWKEIVSLCAIVAIATLFAGVLVGKAGIWFALSALAGIAVSAFVGILYLPAVCVPLTSRSTLHPSVYVLLYMLDYWLWDLVDCTRHEEEKIAGNARDRGEKQGRARVRADPFCGLSLFIEKKNRRVLNRCGGHCGR